jgi:hypothetical protein
MTDEPWGASGDSPMNEGSEDTAVGPGRVGEQRAGEDETAQGRRADETAHGRRADETAHGRHADETAQGRENKGSDKQPWGKDEQPSGETAEQGGQPNFSPDQAGRLGSGRDART